MRTALYGGSFDPPHLGHLAVAREAARAFALDRVLFAPTGRQPLKEEAPGAGYADRFAMVELLCEEEPELLFATALDTPHEDGSPNYTVDVLRAVRHEGVSLFHIVGADSFLQLRQWREPDELLKLAEWIVVSRPGFSLSDLSSLELTSAQMGHVHLLETVHMDVSATQIRDRLAHGDPCLGALTLAVSTFIGLHGLYRKHPSAI